MEISNCCGAPIIENTDLCSQCKEHSAPAEIFSVWVGGTEVNDGYLSLGEAESLAFKYKEMGYDDVAIDC
jgi:hypothetical protein